MRVRLDEDEVCTHVCEAGCFWAAVATRRRVKTYRWCLGPWLWHAGVALLQILLILPSDLQVFFVLLFSVYIMDGKSLRANECV